MHCSQFMAHKISVIYDPVSPNLDHPFRHHQIIPVHDMLTSFDAISACIDADLCRPPLYGATVHHAESMTAERATTGTDDLA